MNPAVVPHKIRNCSRGSFFETAMDPERFRKRSREFSGTALARDSGFDEATVEAFPELLWYPTGFITAATRTQGALPPAAILLPSMRMVTQPFPFVVERLGTPPAFGCRCVGGWAAEEAATAWICGLGAADTAATNLECE